MREICIYRCIHLMTKIYIYVCIIYTWPDIYIYHRLLKISIPIWEGIKNILLLFAYLFTHPFSTFSFVSLQCLPDKVQAHYYCLQVSVFLILSLPLSIAIYSGTHSYIFYIPITSFACTMILSPAWNLAFLSLLPGISFPSLFREINSLIQSNLSWPTWTFRLLETPHCT